MVDYKEMYITLFQATSKAIEILQEAQIATEEMYISTGDVNLTLLERESAKETIKE